MMAFLTLLVSASAFAQTPPRAFAKFVCGKPAREVDNFGFAPGVYYTTINVTNQTRAPITGKKRFSVALPRQEMGPRTDLIDWGLRPGTAMQIDCSDIYKRLNIPPGEFIDGMVYITSSVRFDATAVYTLSDGSRPISIDVEPVAVR